jgi:phage terminase large subunit
MNIPFNFTPRNYQKPLFNSISKGCKRGVSIWHRRAGKDKTFINLIVKESFKRVGAYYYFFPTYNQGRKILWNGMDRTGFPFLSHIPESIRTSTNKTEMCITLRNGSLFQVVGSDNIDSIVGTNPVGCVFSEYSLQDPRGWEFIRPILRENGGWAFFNYTPRGHNHGYRLYQMAKTNPAWFCELLTVDDTKALTPEDIQAERDEGMDEDLIQQEYYCSFEAAVPGAYFAKQLSLARAQGRIGNIPILPGIPVDTFWDLGVNDTTAIWFVQTVGREIRVINYEEDAGEGLEYYASLLRDRAKELGLEYGEHVGPHDINVRELGTGKTRIETAKEYGVSFRAAPRPERKEDSINAARKIFPYCWFDETRCQRGIDALASYHKGWDEKNRVWRLHPIHDWASNGADAFQTMALGHNFKSIGPTFTPSRKTTKSINRSRMRRVA